MSKSNGFVHTQHWCCMMPKMLGNIAISWRWRLVWRGLDILVNFTFAWGGGILTTCEKRGSWGSNTKGMFWLKTLIFQMQRYTNGKRACEDEFFCACRSQPKPTTSGKSAPVPNHLKQTLTPKSVSLSEDKVGSRFQNYVNHVRFQNYVNQVFKITSITFSKLRETMKAKAHQCE